MARAAEFTTYINAIEDPAIDRKFDRLSAAGMRTFDNIRRQAEAANAAISAVGRGPGGLSSSGTQALQRQAEASRLVARNSAEVARALPAQVLGTRAAGVAASEAAKQHLALSRSLTTTATALQVVQGPLGPVAGRITAAGKALASLSGLQLGAAGFGALAFVVGRIGNNYANLEARLKTVYPAQGQVNQAMTDVISIAARSRSALEPVADLYTKLAQNATQFRLSQRQIGTITRVASQAATLSPGNAQSRAAGLYQFSQAIGSNRLGGDELRSILEQVPQLAKAIADGLGVTIGQLRELGTQGVLTTQTVTKALERSADSVDKRFQRLPVTLDAAATEFGNSMTVVIGQFDKAVGLSHGLAAVLSTVAHNLREIMTLVIAVGAGFATIRTARWVEGMVAARAQMRGISTAFGAVATAAERQLQVEATVARTRQVNSAAALQQLRSQKVAIEANIAAMASERRQAQGVVARGPFAGTAGATQFNRRAYQEALQKEQQLTRQLSIATKDLERVKQAAGTASLAYAAAEREVVAAQTALNSAVGASATRVTGWRAVIGNAVKSAMFWQIAITAITFALIEYATRQTSAQKATELARQAMDDYSRVVDETTGKVKTLTEAERIRAEAQAKRTIREFETGTGADARSDLAKSLLNVGAGAGGRSGGGQDEMEEIVRRNQRIGALLRNPATYAQGLDQLNKLANAGNTGIRAWIESNDEALKSVEQLAAAAKGAKVELSVLAGGTAPEAVERQRQRDAERAAEAAAITARMRRENARKNTADDNSRYQSNLGEVYGAYNSLGVLSPEQIQQKQDQIARLQRMPVEKGQEQERARAIRDQNAELAESVRISNQYKGTIEELAKARTKAETAQRDETKALSEHNKVERDAVQQAKANAAAALNNSLLSLEKDRANITPQEYVQRQQGLLAIYDKQIDALNDRANSSQRAETAAIREARRVFEATQDFEQKRADILGRYSDEPRAAVRAAKDIEQLRKLQASLGEGIYPAGALDRDIAAVTDGLQKPFREMVRDQERGREIQMLTLAGREKEAEVLRETWRLIDAGSDVSAEQLEWIRRSVDENERINDLLAQRQRLVSNLQGAVDDTKQALEEFFSGLSRPKDAVKGLVRDLVQNFTKARSRALVEQLTAGADEKVRTLISGRNAVDSASRTFASQINDTSSKVVTLGSASSDTAAMLSAAADEIRRAIAGGFGSPTAPLGVSGGEAAGAGGVVGAVASAVSSAITKRETVLAPLAGITRLSSGFGARTNPITGRAENHPGYDIPADLGTAVRAAFSGVVRQAGANGGFGNSIKIDSGNGLTELYGHLSKLNVTVGQLVRQGQTIGQVGSTGMSTGNHLHFGTYKNGKPVDPGSVLSALVSTGAGSSTLGSGAITGARTTPSASSASRMDELSSIVGSLSSAMDSGGALKVVDLNNAERDLQYPSSGQHPPFPNLVSGLWELPMQKTAAAANGVPTTREAYNAVGSAVGAKLDGIFGSQNSGFFNRIGSKFGDALQGAGEGAIASGFAKAIGIKQSQTGAQIGGAIGGMIPALGPFGGIIGGLIGGTIGGALKKTKKGIATVSADQYGNVGAGEISGNSESFKKQAGALADSVGGTITQIAQQLGADVGAFAVSIGKRDKKFVVNTSGGTKTKGAGTTKYATEEEATQAAILDAIRDGAIKGISEASQRILASGQDLTRALEKATMIESVPKRLLAKTNPVRYAVEALNDDFKLLINAMKEGGATAEQFAQASQLYDLERADAVKQATQDTVSAIDDFLKNMTNSSSSPLSKRTVYNNAQAAFGSLASQVNAGKAVDPNDLVKAAQDFEDASQKLKGSGSGFFADFDTIFDVLTKAKNQATSTAGTAQTDLPPSPFANDQAVQDAIHAANTNQVGAINNQTDILSGRLDEIIIGLNNLGGYSGDGSSINNLPSFSGGGLRGGGGGGFNNAMEMQ